MSSLDSDGFRRLETLFHELLGLPPDERKRRLRRVAEDDPEVHAELASMLEDATDALHHDAQIDELARDAEEMVARGGAPARQDSVPEQIGRYRLLHRLGAGGMGEVWEAEQTEPVSRRVAVKIVRGQNPSGDADARFRAERQALATMDHPNIARVLDAGETPSGLPYYVMELVENAVPLTRYCDRRQLGLEQRLRLFLPICSAVEHAHRKRIIHRDLKPSNVLITEVEGRPIPKVIDFGIAKPLEQALQLGESHATRIGELVGTCYPGGGYYCGWTGVPEVRGTLRVGWTDPAFAAADVWTGPGVKRGTVAVDDRGRLLVAMYTDEPYGSAVHAVELGR